MNLKTKLKNGAYFHNLINPYQMKFCFLINLMHMVDDNRESHRDFSI